MNWSIWVFVWMRFFMYFVTYYLRALHYSFIRPHALMSFRSKNSNHSHYRSSSSSSSLVFCCSIRLKLHKILEFGTVWWICTKIHGIKECERMHQIISELSFVRETTSAIEKKPWRYVDFGVHLCRQYPSSDWTKCKHFQDLKPITVS